jgi:hypothetical protein
MLGVVLAGSDNLRIIGEVQVSGYLHDAIVSAIHSEQWHTSILCFIGIYTLNLD